MATKVIFAAACLFGVSCTGSVGGSPSGVLPPPGGGAGTGASIGGSAGSSGIGTGSAGGAGAGPSGVAPTATLHKLTASQFANSVHDLLGSAVPLAGVEPDTEMNGFAAVGASSVAVSPAGVGQYEAAVGAAMTYVFADPKRLTGAFPCVPQTAADTACLMQALSAFGRHAFRRPLTDAETSRFVNLATTIGSQAGSSILVGFRHAASAILQSPNFLYRVELGAPSPADGGRLKYTSFEMASRLASTLWNTLPDPTLLDAAAQDALATPQGVGTQAQRMLADPRAHQALAAFVDDLYALQNLKMAAPDLTKFPVWTESLRDAMRQELELRVDDVVFATHGDFLSLFDNKTAFVNNELARHYGLPVAATDGFRKVDLPAASPRAGILGSGAILAGLALPQRTAPTRRGKFIREALLCQTIPPPPPGVPPLPPTTDPNATMRQRLTAHRANAVCAVCHRLTDPIGFGLENFDAVGTYRTTENGQPVDATGNLDGVPFTNLAEMGTVLRQSPVAGPCLVSKVYMNALGRAAAEWDGTTLDDLATQFAAGGNRVDQLLLKLVGSDAFRFVQPRQP
jgi:hypothetical protein